MIRSLLLSELCRPLKAQLLGDDIAFDRLSTDTRAIANGDLFLALTGPNFDGHNFAEAAVAAGASALVVDHPLDLEIPQLIVADTRLALGLIGQYNRSLFSGQVIAVTGSSGKTSVKEMLGKVMSANGPTLTTRGNLNNDIGAPLTLLSIEVDHQVAVIELGANAQGEIDYTVGLVQPDVAILNNAMGAHLEGFGGLQGVVKAKGEIFNGLGQEGTAIVNRDDPHADVWLSNLAGRKVLTFGFADTADIRAENLQLQSNHCYRFELVIDGQKSEVKLQVLGRHSVANALAAAAAATASKVSPSQIATGLSGFTGVPGRMNVLAGVNGCQVIDDSYNANAGSVCAAIDVLESLEGQRWLVLGDMAELGDESQEQHALVGGYAAEKGLDALWAVGPESLSTVAAYQANGGVGGVHFEHKAQLIEELLQHAGAGHTFLMKGSRSSAMDQVVNRLTKGEK